MSYRSDGLTHIDNFFLYKRLKYIVLRKLKKNQWNSIISIVWIAKLIKSTLDWFSLDT